MLKFNVNRQIINRTDDFKTVADSRNYLYADFVFSEEWNGIITALFSDGKIVKKQILEDGRCKVPWEVIHAPFFTVSAFCGDLITANLVTVSVEKSGYEQGDEPIEPTPDVYQQIVSLCNEAVSTANSVRSDADNGKFDYTLTESDKSDIADSVRNEYFNDVETALAELHNYAQSLATGGAEQ